jgi:hypothetical protein
MDAAYFILSEDEIKTIVWGDSNNRDDIEESIPIALFPPAVPEDMVKDFLTILVTKDPQGTIGQAVKAAVEAQIEVEKRSVEMSGLAPGEELPPDAEIISPDTAALEGPFVV